MAIPLLSSIRSMPELRNKILFTLGMLAIYRIGFWIPLPIIDQAALASFKENVSTGDGINKLMSTVAMFGGTSIGMSTIFGLGIMPYITASILFTLMSPLIPQLEALSKEGESGRKKINEYTRYATVPFCLLQSLFWLRYLESNNIVPLEFQAWYYILPCVLIMTAGTIFLMWLGEQIDEYGIGNGISMLIMAGILAQLPSALFELGSAATLKLSEAPNEIGPVRLGLLALMFLTVVIGVIMMTESQRRIPTQSARHVRGRRVMTGARHYLPFKVNQAGVMPIIFASSLLMLPLLFFNIFGQLTAGWASDPNSGWFARGVGTFFEAGADSFSTNSSFFYILLNIILIYFFSFLWVAITFKPNDIAENLKDHGSFIPGHRPGAQTARYLEKIMVRITYVGAAFLSLIAIIPTLVQQGMRVSPNVASFLGGTGLLIVVSVCIDLVQKIDAHLVMRNYPSILNKN